MNKVLDKLDHFEKSLNTKYNALLGITAYLVIIIIVAAILVSL
ncbi:hypothetical protein D9V96_019545 [Zobellia laminariae]